MAREHAMRSATLADVLEMALDKGVGIAGDVKITRKAALPAEERRT